MTFFSDGNGGTPSHFGRAANLWYDIRDTYIVRVVVDGCRKNLPLHDRTNHDQRRGAILRHHDVARKLR